MGWVTNPECTGVPAARAREAAWVAVLFAVVCAALCASYVPYYAFGPDARHSAAAVDITIAVRETTALVVLGVLARRYLGISFADLGVVRPTLADLGIGLVAGVVLVACAYGIEHVSRERDSWLFNAMIHGDAVARGGALVVVGVWSPFVQEVVFRGALLRAFRERVSAPMAVAASALIFAFGHIASGWPTVVLTIVVGALLGALTLRRRSLVAPVVAHIIVNSVATVSLIAALALRGR
jgi:membrane protease YdiL (CAAX protease family)